MSIKIYKCKYCNYRGTKEDLVSHTEEEHSDLIPQNFTAARLVFNNIHKKDHGICVICKRETKWNEKTWKYNRLCGRDACKKALRKTYEKNMIKVYNTTTLLNDPEQQEKMLSHRSISGSYKFNDGGVRTYTGSYEKKTLEFFDKVLNVKSDDIITPGPVFEYEFEGKTHKWITDILYIPANLIIEVKDGGSNPNTRKMDSYRAKQVAKEKMITDLGTYNYLRLTDNNFEQLLLVLAELKQQMIDDSEENKKAIISINEEVGGMPPAGRRFTDTVYIIPYGYNNVFTDDMEGCAFTTSLDSDNLLTVDENNNIVSIPSNELLTNRNYTVFECKHTGKACRIISEDIKSNKKVDRDYFYNIIANKEMFTDDQLFLDKDFEEVCLHKSNIIADIKAHSLQAEVKNINNEKYYLKIMSPTLNRQISEKLKNYKNLSIVEDIEGFFAMNEMTNYRTKSYDSIHHISDEELQILELL